MRLKRILAIAAGYVIMLVILAAGMLAARTLLDATSMTAGVTMLMASPASAAAAAVAVLPHTT